MAIPDDRRLSVADFAGADRSWRLRGSPDAPRRARRLVRSWLADDPARPERAERAELLVSELVTNVVHHVGSDMVVRCSRRDDRIRIEVTDPSSIPPLIAGVPSAGGGYGLRIVEALADSWGFDTSDRGKSVWFELRDADAPQPSA
jgi:anti-sigma regulatory factor (Ser/Thr protein kinase)